jgi:hypothetical protein
VAVFWHRWLGNSLSQCMPKFDPRPVHVGFVVDRGAYWITFLFKYLSFPLSLSLHQCSILLCHASKLWCSVIIAVNCTVKGNTFLHSILEK